MRLPAWVEEKEVPEINFGDPWGAGFGTGFRARFMGNRPKPGSHTPTAERVGGFHEIMV